LAGVSDHEEVTQTFVEDDFSGEPGISAAKECDLRMLAAGNFTAVLNVLSGVLGLASNEAIIASAQATPRF
jgi:hypothetical protein